MSIGPKRILIVYDHRDSPKRMRLTIKQHLHALESSDVKHELLYYNTSDEDPYPAVIRAETPAVPPSWVHDGPFDVVILHYAFLSYRFTGSFFYKWKRHFSWIGELDCLKIAIPQDEFDCNSLLDEWLFDWGVSAVLSVHYSEQGPLYPIMRDKADFYRCLSGYIDKAAARRISGKLLPPAARPYDIVYRARQLPYWFGKAGQLKYQIANVVASCARTYGLKCNISTRAEDAILGDRWLDFIASGKAVIGCEGGSSVIDWRGEIKAQIEALLREDATLSFAEVSARMPFGWDDYRLFTITPRHFDAIITKTCQILVEGDYRGVLEPDKHYIPLKGDFSNVDEALQKLRDEQFVQDMVERAYEDVYLSGNYTYQTYAKKIEQVIFDQEQKSMKRGGHSESMTKRNGVVELLERQLVAERHNNALLRAKLLEAKEGKGVPQNQMRWPSMGWKKTLLLVAVVVMGIAASSTVITLLVLMSFGIL
ncbi:MAG: hypothetical protein GTO24_04870 [candidate division Zixibacteria bacterium]|nr:hypothetical protein [candidate division Zixibacteria bacterium]